VITKANQVKGGSLVEDENREYDEKTLNINKQKEEMINDIELEMD